MQHRTINPFLLCDAYKIGHVKMYPEGTEFVTCNFTPRSLKHANGIKTIVVFGMQMTMREIHDLFEIGFFTQTREVAVDAVKKVYSTYTGSPYDATHIHALWELGYLPIKVKALEEGTLINPGIPVMTITNTLEEQFWLPNFLETLLSTLMWKPMTSASIAYRYRGILDSWAKKTDSKNMESVWYQGHDFSMRGLDSVYSSMSSGLGHALSFRGSDTIPVIHGAVQYYDAVGAEVNVVNSIPASEHSVMSAGTDYSNGLTNEYESYRRLLEIYPNGILSLVSDTFNLWVVITVILPQLKKEIMGRDGKLVIRPDSGDPVDIICGTNEVLDERRTGLKSKAECKGVIELLWDIFGGTINDDGYKVLDSHIGAIYGDSITLSRCEQICERLKEKGFASTNMVFGIGSFTYQFNTRDTLGLAMKATHCVIKGESRDIFKNPITDDGLKKSAKGLIAVRKDNSVGDVYEIKAYDQQTPEEASIGLLRTIYDGGYAMNQTTIDNIRAKIKLETKRLAKLELRNQPA